MKDKKLRCDKCGQAMPSSPENLIDKSAKSTKDWIERFEKFRVVSDEGDELVGRYGGENGLIIPADFNKIKQFILDLLKEEYQRGFNEGAKLTGRIAEEVYAIDLEEQGSKIANQNFEHGEIAKRDSIEVERNRIIKIIDKELSNCCDLQVLNEVIKKIKV